MLVVLLGRLHISLGHKKKHVVRTIDVAINK